LTAIIISGSSKARAESYAINLAKGYTLKDKINILGPVEAPLFLLRGQYRFRLLLKANSRRKLNNFTRNLIKNCPTPLNLRLIVDVDPYTFI
jgi:primosomal protein N' (replication factor Y)